MNRITLAAAAILVATGSAFAGSDHYGSNNADQTVAPVASVDHAIIGAVSNTDMAGYKVAEPKTKATTDLPESGQGIWGN
ncbi:DUF680 domain-containing protein [Mesorhizobium kowhaii]|uniref:DUF680 domain-containing protein n=1 Tax=Mesorhizobium kowhaii TaxID=1300272 RepID=UPI0035EAFE92